MQSVILEIAARHFLRILIIVSVLVLYIGHNMPGGGFIGGLILGSAFVIYAMAFGVEETRAVLRFNPLSFISTGLLLALGSGIVAIFSGQTFLTGQWFELFPNSKFALKLGTPLLFDVGVYFTVAGMLTLVVFSIKGE
jgi:multisubunit Na+/H+ antiporter MnhB subunit